MSKKVGSKPLRQQMIGNVPLRTVITGNDKDRYMASGTFNGKQFIGNGDSVRQATLDLRRKLDSSALKNEIQTKA